VHLKYAVAGLSLVPPMSHSQISLSHFDKFRDALLHVTVTTAQLPATLLGANFVGAVLALVVELLSAGTELVESLKRDTKTVKLCAGKILAIADAVATTTKMTNYEVVKKKLIQVIDLVADARTEFHQALYPGDEEDEQANTEVNLVVLEHCQKLVNLSYLTMKKVQQRFLIDTLPIQWVDAWLSLCEEMQAEVDELVSGLLWEGVSHDSTISHAEKLQGIMQTIWKRCEEMEDKVDVAYIIWMRQCHERCMEVVASLREKTQADVKGEQKSDEQIVEHTAT